MVVTTLEASSETVPRIDVVVERLMNEEQKMIEVKNTEDYRKGCTPSFHNKGPPKRKIVHCHYCKKLGHFIKHCRKLLAKYESKDSKSREAAMKAISSGSVIHCYDDLSVTVRHNSFTAGGEQYQVFT